MMHNKETELLVFWTWKLVPKRYECCFCCYQIFDPKGSVFSRPIVMKLHTH